MLISGDIYRDMEWWVATKEILAVCKDVGGTNALLPVIDLLKPDYRVRWIVQDDGRGKDILKNLGNEFEIYSSVGQVKKDDVAIVISSMCSNAGQDFARCFKGVRPIITIQDQWTAGLNDVWTDPSSRPEFIFVNDEFDKKLVLQAWSDYNPDRVLATGYTALDWYFNFDIQAAKERVNAAIQLNSQLPIVLFAGQWWETGHAISELIRVLNELKFNVNFIPRHHPAMKDNVPEEAVLWDESLAKFDSGMLIDSSSYGSISDLIAASDLVVSMYSTTLQEAAVLRIQNIAILYPEHGLKVYIDNAKTSEYPMTAMGCTANASNYEELKNLMHTFFTSSLGLRSTQEKVFRLDGKNAQRVANTIRYLI